MIDAAYFVKTATAIVWCAATSPDRTACGQEHTGWMRELNALGAGDDICPNCENVLATTVTLIGGVSP